MSSTQPTALEPHPFHTLISWQAVLAGAVVAIAAGAMLNLLGVALGAASINPFDLSRGEAEAFSAGAGAWVAIANALALFAGGFVASRVAKYSDHHKGYLHGLSVWALAFLIALFLAGGSAVGGIQSMMQGMDNNGVDEPYIVDDVVPPLAGPDSAPAVPPAARPAASQAADATATMALWAFVTMLLGAVAAVFGGRYGARRHSWETRAHVTETPATVVGTDPHLHPRPVTPATQPPPPAI